MSEKPSVSEQSAPTLEPSTNSAIQALLDQTFSTKSSGTRHADVSRTASPPASDSTAGASDKVMPFVIKDKPATHSPCPFDSSRFVKDGEFRTLTWPSGWKGSAPIKDGETDSVWHMAKPTDASDPAAAMALIRNPEKLDANSTAVKTLRNFLLNRTDGADPQTIAELKDVMGRFGDNQYTNPGQNKYVLNSMSSDLINGKPVLSAAFRDAQAPGLNFNVIFTPDFSVNASGQSEAQIQMLVLRTSAAKSASSAAEAHYADFNKTIDNIWWKDRWPKEDKKTILY